MKPEEFSLADWSRILMGDAPWIFLVELLIRSLVVYVTLLFFMRLMGKRVAAQMSATELAVILMLGAAVGLPIQVPENGLLPGVAVLAVVLICHRGLSHWTFKNRKIEIMTHGEVIILARDGRLFPKELRKNYFSPDHLFALLRSEGIEQLGEVRRVYLEAWGQLSLVRYRKAKPGLLILPSMELPMGRYTAVQGLTACGTCGNVVDAAPQPESCGVCGDKRWREAVEASGSG